VSPASDCIIKSLPATPVPRWLIDTDQDELGFQVITDLHGGDPENPKAKHEFQEIKESVMRDVRTTR
jgi:hypothetical protein